ncbi:hypothetical protein [Halorussus lipolyticus]|uniref:hypothetical protein n=1 Tax=Halorussus lipolyticus TaxID=3034024 RepID=UPI0023E81A94|nr:hypothetical protein [Halorussus sp. DT80]
MDWNALVAPVVRYTVVAALVTVGAAYLAFSSGLTLLLLSGAGVILVVLGAAEAGAAPAAGVGAAESGDVGSIDSGGMGAVEEGMELVPGVGSGSGSNYSLRAKLLFYGLGLLVWGIAGMAILLR